MSRSTRPTAPRRAPLLIAGAVLVALVAVAVAIVAARPPAAPTATVKHFVDLKASGADTTLRTVVVAGSDAAIPHISGTDGILMTSLIAGQIPRGISQARVTSDANCQPDAAGVSHCLNDMVIGTTKVTVRHYHKMAITPCLTPGETVNVINLDEYQG